MLIPSSLPLYQCCHLFYLCAWQKEYSPCILKATWCTLGFQMCLVDLPGKPHIPFNYTWPLRSSPMVFKREHFLMERLAGWTGKSNAIGYSGKASRKRRQRLLGQILDT